MKTYIFNIQFLHDKKISREIEVPENITLYKLAEVIASAYDFCFDHCFGFYSDITDRSYFDSEKQYELFADLDDVESTTAESVKKTKIDQVWKQPKDKMMFLFDYGDDWRFIVVLKGFGQKDTNEKYPFMLDKKGKLEQYPEYDE